MTANGLRTKQNEEREHLGQGRKRAAGQTPALRAVPSLSRCLTAGGAHVLLHTWTPACHLRAHPAAEDRAPAPGQRRGGQQLRTQRVTSDGPPETARRRAGTGLGVCTAYQRTRPGGRAVTPTTASWSFSSKTGAFQPPCTGQRPLLSQRGASSTRPFIAGRTPRDENMRVMCKCTSPELLGSFLPVSTEIRTCVYKHTHAHPRDRATSSKCLDFGESAG